MGYDTVHVIALLSVVAHVGFTSRLMVGVGENDPCLFNFGTKIWKS